MPSKSSSQRGSPADLLQLIREAGPLSRTDLARRSGLAASTVSLRIEGLVSAGLVEEAGDGTSTGGRRPRMLRASSGGGVALAADLGTHHARLAVTDLAGQPLAEDELEVSFDDGPTEVLEAIASALSDLAAGRRVLGVGMGLPGPVDPEAGQIVSPSRMPGWHGMRVRSWLASRFDVPVVVDNDANLMALGEYRSRWAHAGVRHLVAVKVGRGIGCGIIAGGVVHRGANGAAGDISHVQVSGLDASVAGLCGCGRRGCVETLASGAALLEPLGLSSVTELVAQVHRGDAAANQAVRSAGRYLGEVLAVVVNFFNPKVLVLGGSLAAADPLLASLRATIYEKCLPMASEAVTITTVCDGPKAGVTGAAALILDHLAEAATTS